MTVSTSEYTHNSVTLALSLCEHAMY